MSLADKQKEEQDRIVKTVALEKAQVKNFASFKKFDKVRF